MNRIKRFTRTLVRVSSPAPATQVVVQERLPRGVHIPNPLIANNGAAAYLAAGYYGSIKDAVRCIRFIGMPVVSYGRDSRNWFCAIVRHANGQDFYYGIDFERGCIACCGPAPSRVKVVQQVTIQRTRWL